MSFSRINYDQCAYDLQINRSVAPGNYRLFPGSVDNCNKCYPYNQPSNSKEQVSVARSNCDTGFGSLATVESELTNRTNYLEKCNKEGKNNGYLKAKVFHKPLCAKTIESEDTRFTNPLDNYRGMSLTGFYFNPYLHVNPQCQIQSNKDRNGNSTRQYVKDSYRAPNQEYWDNGQTLPPKPKKVERKSCKTCCT
jgi:hypothetical protein|uniref:Uncharacterized protein n=1 Tax=viral metagenome TaxID=1070528 RepID=A0A6C0ITW7_9ZZZZ